MPCGEGGGGWLICVRWQLVDQRHHAHYFLIRMAHPRPNYYWTLPMESLNHYSWLKGLRAVKTLAESVLWLPETNEIRCALGVPVSLIKCPNFDSWVSLVSIKSVPIFYQKCSSIGSKVSQRGQLCVPMEVHQLPVLAATLLLLCSFCRSE